MSRWTCPHCGGGAPVLVPFKGEAVCPWCYEPALAEHENPEEVPTTPSSAIREGLGRHKGLVPLRKHESETYR